MKSAYTAIIVDDEKAAREQLQSKLSMHREGVLLLHSISDPLEAVQIINQELPDLLFLDVQMPGMNGFELLKTLKTMPDGVIFTTSFDTYAIEAFRFSAIDYLLKPFSEDQLAEALKRFYTKQELKVQSKHLQNLLSNLEKENNQQQKIALPTSSGYVFVTVGDIIRCESENVYTTFYLINKSKIVVSRSIKEVEQQLSAYKFARIHQSHLVNLNLIRKYHRGDGGQVELENGDIVDVARARKEMFLELFKKI